MASAIESGSTSSGLQLGYSGYLGVALSPNATGATVYGVLSGGPAADAGLSAGDTVTAVDGAAVATADELHAAIAAHAPGDRVSVSWTTSNGRQEATVVTLGQAPVA